MPPSSTIWRDRALRLWLSAAASVVGGLGGVLRNKWLALHLDPSGLGILGQVFAGQVWLGTATGLGLGLPVAQAIGAALGRSDQAAVRRALSTALTVIAATAVGVALAGLMLAPWISGALLGTAEYAWLVRISMLAVAGLAFQGTIQGLFAGYSDVRASFTYALAGNAAMLLVVFLAVPRFGLGGGVWGVAVFWPAAFLGALLLHRRRYRDAFVPAPSPRFDRTEARAMIKVALAALLLALMDQGTLLALRARYVRVLGVEANGLLQAALALSQAVGAVFYAYLGGYAFGKVSGQPGITGVRDYTRRQWTPLVTAAWACMVVVMLAATPLLHLLYSARFDGARPLLAWTLVGEFGRVAALCWALGALPAGGVRLWFPIGASWPLGMALAWLLAHGLGASALDIPLAYTGAGLLALLSAATLMSRRGVTLPVARAALPFLGLAALALIAAAITR